MRIRREILDALIALAREAAPRECCGVLLGADDRIAELFPTANLATSPARFLVDPRGHIDARRHARARGLAVVGFYHSHPVSAPRPSEADLAEATYDGLLYLIVGIAGTPSVAAYRLERGQFTDIALEAEP